MSAASISPPKTGKELVDEYFIENRTRLLDVAAFLDRLDRASDGPAEDDFRMRALRESLEILCSGEFPRVEQIEMIYSDPTDEPLEALDLKSARGAYDRWKEA